jgi:hypothetical protein
MPDSRFNLANLCGYKDVDSTVSALICRIYIYLGGSGLCILYCYIHQVNHHSNATDIHVHVDTHIIKYITGAKYTNIDLPLVVTSRGSLPDPLK